MLSMELQIGLVFFVPLKIMYQEIFMESRKKIHEAKTKIALQYPYFPNILIMSN